MKRSTFLLAAAASVLLPETLSSPAEAAPPSGKRPPNILLILTDDLGYGDLGVFFQNERRAKRLPAEVTPNIDRLADEGIQLRGMYCPAPVCAPSRGSLLAGVTQGHAGVRDNQFDKALENNHTLASVLKAAGYATAAIGKWGLQGSATGKTSGEEDVAAAGGPVGSPETWPAYPTRRGFDSFFGYVRHSDGHEHYPKEGLHGGPKQVWDNDREVSAQLDRCYTADLFTARAKRWITEQRSAHPDQPFFLYLAYDTPHATTELPTGPYPAGGGLNGGIQWTGKPGAMINTAQGIPDSYIYPEFRDATYTGPSYVKAPDPADADVVRSRPWPDVYKRYASAVHRLDDCVGDIAQLLRDLKIEGETLVLFTSDNGPSNESYLREGLRPDFFESFARFDGIKRDCWEGGVRVGAIARWPGVIPPHRVSEAPMQFQDLMPTFAELAGITAPARTDGVSLVPTLTGRGMQKPSMVYVEYFFAGKTPGYPVFDPAHRSRVRRQMQLLRLGDMVGVRYDIQSQADDFEIYNITQDPQETKNLAAQYPQMERAMKDAVLRMRRPDPSAKRPYDRELVPSVAAGEAAAPGVAWSAYKEAAPWVAKYDALAPFRSGRASRPDMAVVPADASGVLFTGYIEAPADGEYVFSLTADTGALLRLHEATVIDADFGYPSGTRRTGAILLKAGRHPFRLYCRQATGHPRALRLGWTGPNGADGEIPAAAFSHGSNGSDGSPAGRGKQTSGAGK